MIKKLRREFIVIATVAVLVIMAVLVFVINVTIYSTIDSFVDNVVARLQGDTPSQTTGITGRLFGTLDSQDVFYYQITVDSKGSVIAYDDSHNPQTLTRDEAQTFVNQAKAESDDSHRFHVSGRYFAWYAEKQGSRTVYTLADYSFLMRWVGQIRTLSLIVTVIAFAAFEIIVIALSRRAIRPAIDNAERQKRFITNASHELKTPVAVIAADNEVIEAMHGRDEWTESITHQVQKLGRLITSLVTLARGTEEKAVTLADTDVSAIITERADAIKPLAVSRGLTLERAVGENLHAKTDAKTVGQLADILLDNAVKYCDDGGTIAVSAAKTGAHVTIAVTNDYANAAQVNASKFFERFYRADTSHNSGTQGFGIGLSIAADLTRAIHAKIRVSTAPGRITFTVTL